MYCAATITDGTKCFWDPTANNNGGSCLEFTSVANCASLTGLTNATHSTC